MSYRDVEKMEKCCVMNSRCCFIGVDGGGSHFKFQGAILLAKKCDLQKETETCCWWLKSCTSWYGKCPIICRVSYIPGGAGFPPSTVLVLFSPLEGKWFLNQLSKLKEVLRWSIESTEQWKKGSWLFRVYRGWNTTQFCGDYFINHYKDPY